ncbi:hypothetical protein Pla52n_06920 [Stieleria varia]|uniref:Uncharacterized protein n=1 Tax=Stieleria varia TaxID=2528005 RepID=A0A5C6B9J6_9BACT|nr:hypothetical protein Pla52n_06920 [Stieleria varia]
MSTKFLSAVQRYCKAKKHSKGTSDEYKATVRKWISWGQEIPVEQLSRSSIRDFLDWVYAMRLNKEVRIRSGRRTRHVILSALSPHGHAENDKEEKVPTKKKRFQDSKVGGHLWQSHARLREL